MQQSEQPEWNNFLHGRVTAADGKGSISGMAIARSLSPDEWFLRFFFSLKHLGTKHVFEKRPVIAGLVFGFRNQKTGLCLERRHVFG